MNWKAAKKIAKAGRPVRRPSDPVGKSLVYYRDIGSTAAVACKRLTTTTSTTQTNTVTPLKNSEFGAADFKATDWVEAS